MNTTSVNVAETGTTSTNKLFVGVDMAKTDFAVAIGYQGQYTYCDKTANSAEASVAFADQMEASRQKLGALAIHLVIEPTGGYEQQLVSEAHRRGWLVTLVNPLDVRHWAKGRGKRAKTDRQDALMLAAFGSERNPPAQQPTDESAAELDDLLRRQADLEKLLRSERNREGQIAANPRTPQAVQDSVKRTIKALEQELAHIDEAIKALFAMREKLARQLQQLQSVPGIGKKTAPHLLALFYRFQARTAGRGTAKQLVAYVGLDPKPFESGTTVFQRAVISRQGDAPLRSKLFLCALGGVRGHNPMQAFYTSLCARGKAKKLALIACARKALVWAWAVFTQDTTFDSSLFLPA
jgi:transposase